MTNDNYIGRITAAGMLDQFICDAKAISADMHRTGRRRFEFEKRVTSFHPIEKTMQEANAACEVFRIAAKEYFSSEFGTWQRDLIGKYGIFN